MLLYEINKTEKLEDITDVLTYAKNNLKLAGEGTSRIAYKYGDKVLKISKNKKGDIQNKNEIELMIDPNFKKLELTVPLIDYDRKNGKWLLVEAAKSINNFKPYTGNISLMDFLFFVDVKLHDTPYSKEDLKYIKVDESAPFVKNFIKFIKTYDVHFNEFRDLSNWGLYNNKPVIIDLGTTKDSIKNYH